MTKNTEVKETAVANDIENTAKEAKGTFSKVVNKVTNFVRRHKTTIVEGVVVAGVVGASIYLSKRDDNSEGDDEPDEASEDEAKD